ncbi:MAG: ribonuclease H family protein, partial [Marinobacter sp.]|uniref:Ty3/Gypsy family RNase HI domain-containing protein n=1 Tax=Marinobacter sp. TaxID=50741 RepID=UPI0032672846
MEDIVRQILAELAAPPILVFPDWDAVSDGSRPFHAYCDACIDGFGAALEQEQSDGSVRSITYTSRATLDSERHGTPLDLEAGNIVWAIKRLRGFLWGRKFQIFSDHKTLESIGNVGDHNARVQRWLELFTAFDYNLEYRKGSANGNADFLS